MRLFGVIKLFDQHGRLRDAAPYFGGFDRYRFAAPKEPYVLSRAVIALPTGDEMKIALEYDYRLFPAIGMQMTGLDVRTNFSLGY